MVGEIAAASEQQSASVEEVTASVDEVSAIARNPQQELRKSRLLQRSRRHQWTSFKCSKGPGKICRGNADGKTSRFHTEIVK